MSATHRLLRFGAFELNLDTEELRKFGTPVKLRPQPFRLLALLASRAGQVVAREEIQRQLWGEETYVDFEHGVNKCIKQIRTALSDSAETPVYVETIPRRGYRFLPPVTAKTVLAPPARVRESSSGIPPDIARLIRARMEEKSKAGEVVHADDISTRNEPQLSPPIPPATAEEPPAHQRLAIVRGYWIAAAAFATLLMIALLYWRSW